MGAAFSNRYWWDMSTINMSAYEVVLTFYDLAITDEGSTLSVDGKTMPINKTNDHKNITAQVSLFPGQKKQIHFKTVHEHASIQIAWFPATTNEKKNVSTTITALKDSDLKWKATYQRVVFKGMDYECFANQ